MNRSAYRLCEVQPDRVFIEDSRIAGTMSVTNDAERVVEEVNKHWPDRRIIYKDTEGQWSELLHVKGSFMGFTDYK